MVQGAGCREQGQAQSRLEPRHMLPRASLRGLETSPSPCGEQPWHGQGQQRQPEAGAELEQDSPRRSAAAKQDKLLRLTADPDAQHRQAAQCHGPRLPWCCTRPGQPHRPGAPGSQCSPGHFSPTSFQISSESIPPLPRGYFPSTSGEGGCGGTGHGDAERPTRDGSSGTAVGTTRFPAPALVEGSAGLELGWNPSGCWCTTGRLRAHRCGAGAVAAAEASRTQTWAANKG